MDRPSRGLIGGLVAALGLAIVAGAPAASAADLPSISARYTVGSYPNAVAISADGSRVVTPNMNSNSLSIITRATGTVTTAPVGSSPRTAAVTPDGAKAYVANYLGDTVSVVDLATATATATIPGLQRPGGVAFSGDGLTAFVPNGGMSANTIAKISVVGDSVTGTLAATLPGCLTPSPDGVTFFTCVALGTSINLFTTSSPTATNVNLFPYSSVNSGAFSPDGSTLYVTHYNEDAVSIIDVSSRTLRAQVPVGDYPSSTAVHPNGQRVFVGNYLGSSLTVLSPSGATLATTSLGSAPDDVAVSNDGQYVLVTTTGGSLIVLDATGTQILTTLSLGGTPSGIAVSRTGNFAAISLSDANQVVIVDLPPAPASGDQVPTAAMQQYAPAPGEACGENPPDVVDFPGLIGARTSGWGTSWAQWPNGGLGGVVCTRQPFYTSAGAWSVR